jgi:hypothetical protein
VTLIGLVAAAAIAGILVLPLVRIPFYNWQMSVVRKPSTPEGAADRATWI